MPLPALDGAAEIALGPHWTRCAGFGVRARGLTRTPRGPSLVGRLDEIFTDLDAIASRHGVEKIKTIGDCYMGTARDAAGPLDRPAARRPA
jgi:class 3 adenylate cyclase